MDEMERRLAACFSAVLPELAAEEISLASARSVESWDSVATISLIAVVEEEFGINVEIDEPAQFDSFQGVLNYLRKCDIVKRTAVDPV
ncbi:MAG TPA: acyl carrier protein [Candidatus Sulfotelmatobacter sp.]|nr:acyl carrier protein [Candidatus Sulfotelmatobacter sp.]